MLTFTELSDELSYYTYRPGWMMTLWEDPMQGILLHIVAEVENAYDTSEPVVLKINTWLPPMHTKKQFGEFLAWRLRQIEIHESMEWLKRRGVCLEDPHKDVDPPMNEVNRVWSQAEMRRMRNQDAGRNPTS